jgi:CxxC motif-containing protein (DUF1111 family)
MLRRLFKKSQSSKHSVSSSILGLIFLVGALVTSASQIKNAPGGDTTVVASGKNAFSFAATNLTAAEQTRFAIGNSFFKRNWVETPASTSARDGLGPHFIGRSCAACHLFDGRGAPPAILNGINREPPVALLIRLSIPGIAADGGPMPEPTYGDQLNNFAISGVTPEGQIQIQQLRLTGRFADGSSYHLNKPLYSTTDLHYGAMASNVMMSPRIAPQLIGVGLIDAISAQDIITNQADQHNSKGPIKGKVNWVWDAFAEKKMVGRFGWKANVATLAHQTASAFVGDIGITSSRFLSEPCTAKQLDCLLAQRLTKGLPDIDDKTLSDVIFYQAVLAPVQRRNTETAQVLRGEKLFHQAQCAACHRPSYKTTQGPFPNLSSPALNGQTIYPYTDLLLHDMGADLADGRPDFLATGQQWKTPPLWGIGIIKEVNGHQRLLHDGRANGVQEAILWHGGEASGSRAQFKAMKRQDRAALVNFVESL